MSQVETRQAYHVKDMSLADFGRKEITLAEHEMPGLMALRRKYGPQKPLAGARIMGSLHMTVQTAVLIETLKELGADVRWASCNIFSTQDHAAAAIAATGTPVFAFKGESLDEYWEFTKEAMTWPDGSGPELIVDDGGDATLLIHRGYQAEDDPAHSRRADGQQGIGHRQSRAQADAGGRLAVLPSRGQPMERRLGGNDHRRPPAVPDDGARRTAGAGHQRERLGHQEQVRQRLRLPPFADRRDQSGHRRDDRRQRWPWSAATATWARGRPNRWPVRRRGCWSPKSIRSVPCRP